MVFDQIDLYATHSLVVLLPVAALLMLDIGYGEQPSSYTEPTILDTGIKPSWLYFINEDCLSPGMLAMITQSSD